jgi:hypothetical protein
MMEISVFSETTTGGAEGVPGVDGFKYLLIPSQECNHLMGLLSSQRPFSNNDSIGYYYYYYY